MYRFFALLAGAASLAHSLECGDIAKINWQDASRDHDCEAVLGTWEGAPSPGVAFTVYFEYDPPIPLPRGDDNGHAWAAYHRASTDSVVAWLTSHEEGLRPLFEGQVLYPWNPAACQAGEEAACSPGEGKRVSYEDLLNPQGYYDEAVLNLSSKRVGFLAAVEALTESELVRRVVVYSYPVNESTTVISADPGQAVRALGVLGSGRVGFRIKGDAYDAAGRALTAR